MEENRTTKVMAKYGTAAKPTEIELSDADFDQISRVPRKDLYASVREYNSMLAQRITFINPQLTAFVPFTMKNLYLICAYTGSGKSTIAANVSFALYQQGKKTLIVSNEESTEDVYMRIGCLEKGYDFNSYKKGTMPMTLQVEVMKEFAAIQNLVRVVDAKQMDGVTTKLEGVRSILKKAQAGEYSCVLIDYFQLIRQSTANPTASTYEVLNSFRLWLQRYIQDSNIPVVLFAQLHSKSKRPGIDIDSRIKHCPDIVEPATVIIEVVPDFVNCKSDFIIHKDRFGAQGKHLALGYDHGRFVSYDDAFKAKVAATKIQQLQSAVSAIADDEDDDGSV